MALSRYFGSERGVRDHLLRGRGVSREIVDLRKDVERAFLAIQNELDSSETRQPATIHVDQATSAALSDQDGSVLRPFSTLSAAVAYANASPMLSWHFQISFGLYNSEPTIPLLPNRRYLFEGPMRSLSVLMLPQFQWTVTGSNSCLVIFRTISVGVVNIVDGVSPATAANLIYENSLCSGINAVGAASNIVALLAGFSVAAYSFTSTPAVLSVVRNGAINIPVGTIFASNTQFEATCTLVRCGQIYTDGCSLAQNLECTNVMAEMRRSLWISNGLSFTFSGSPGQLNLDSITHVSFHERNISLVGGGHPRLTDQLYDPSVYLPKPEGPVTSDSTRVAQTNFDGAVYRLFNWVRFTHLYVRVTAQSGGATTIAIALYQRHDGFASTPQFLAAVGTLSIASTGTFLIPMVTLPGVVELGPGPLWCLYGRVSGGGTATFRTYGVAASDFLTDPTVVPVDAYPTSFTTNIPVSATPPSTLDPTASGGSVTPGGALNLPLVFRLATPP